MKPAFALSFSETGISLTHHSDDDWYTVGSVPIDASDLGDQMHALRDNGFALENDLNCKLVLPRDQIRFLSIATEGLNSEDIATQVQVALSEATPYALSELSFDTDTQGDTTYVAAVARQTLDEAQAFAVQYGFVPAAFSADAREAEFPREPRFELPPETITQAPVAVAVAPEDELSAVEETEATQPLEATPQPDVDEEATVQTPTVDEQEPPVEDTTEPDSEPSPKVHAIAESPSPETFRSLEVVATSSDTSTETAPGMNRYTVPAVAAALIAALSIGAWSLMGSDTDTDVAIADTSDAAASTEEHDTATAADVSGVNTPEEPASQVAQALQQPQENATEASVDTSEPATAPDEPTDLTPTDSAILEALEVSPVPVEQIARDTAVQETVASQPGVTLAQPIPLTAPDPVPDDELYLASIDPTDLSRDAIALPPSESFETDLPLDNSALANVPTGEFDLDARGLVTPSPEGTLNPEGVLVFEGRPSSVPPDVPTRFEEEPVIDEAGQRLADYRPRARPSNLIELFERQQLGGRSLEELSAVRPKPRPESLQAQPEVDETPTALAVVRVPRPKPRPATVARAASAQGGTASNLGSVAAVDQSGDEAGSFQPKSVSPKVPTTASVARQATIDNAINLRRLNLIGVYGTPANRRALVRLPSGRYKKLKIGDRLDGGKVIAISDSELRYQKKGRNLKLTMPRG